jgi:hypothetical protein
MSKSKTFKFAWVPNSKSVTKKDLPNNELDQKPGYIEQNSITNLVDTFKKSDFFKQLKDLLKTDDYKNDCKGKPQKYSQLPKLEQIPILYLFTALAVQRKIDWDHLFRIVTTWDSRRPATVNVIRLPGTNTYYITDGQHTVLAIAIRAMLGLFDDVDKNDWMNVKVNCQVVETSDFSFAREHFLGINGADKLPIMPFDTHKINVFGSRLDNSSQEKYVIADRKQSAFELYNLIPIHPESVDRFKPGAVIHANLIKKLDVEDIKFFGENHNTYWPQEPLDSIEMLPFQELRKKLIKEGADFNAPEFKEFMRDLNALVKEVAGGWPEFKNLTQKLYPAYYKKAFQDDAKGCPADASLVLLMQLYKKAGGTYQYVPNSLVTRYREKNTEMFKQLDSAKKELFK